MPSTVDTHLPARAPTHILRRLAVFTRHIRNPTKTDDFTPARSPALYPQVAPAATPQAPLARTVDATLSGDDGAVLSSLACLVRPPRR